MVLIAPFHNSALLLAGAILVHWAQDNRVRRGYDDTIIRVGDPLRGQDSQAVSGRGFHLEERSADTFLLYLYTSRRVMRPVMIKGATCLELFLGFFVLYHKYRVLDSLYNHPVQF